MMRAQERLYLNADKTKVVGEGDPKAAFLYAAQGDEIPQSAAERFGLVDGRLKPKAGKASPVATLLGSSTLAPTYDVGGKTVQLGTLVADAHKRSGFTVEQWNALPDGERDGLISTVLEELKAAGTAAAEKPETRPTPKPETPPTPKPAAPAKKAAAKKKAAPAKGN